MSNENIAKYQNKTKLLKSMRAKNPRRRSYQDIIPSVADKRTRGSTKALEEILSDTTNDGRLIDESVPSGIFTNFKDIVYPEIAKALAIERRAHTGPADYITSKVCNLMVERDSYKSRVEELETELKSLRDKKTSSRIPGHEMQINELESKLVAFSHDMDEIQEEKRKLTSEVNYRGMMIEGLQNKLTRQLQDTEKTKLELQEAKKKLVEYNQNMSELKSKVKLTEHLNRSEHEKFDLEKQSNNRKQKNLAYEAQLKDRDEKIKELKQRIEDLNHQLERAKKEKEEFLNLEERLREIIRNLSQLSKTTRPIVEVVKHDKITSTVDLVLNKKGCANKSVSTSDLYYSSINMGPSNYGYDYNRMRPPSHLLYGTPRWSELYGVNTLYGAMPRPLPDYGSNRMLNFYRY